MKRYEVFLHNVPKVEDGKAVPIEPHQTSEFSALEEAQKYAAEHRTEYERVVVMQTADDRQKMIERYIDGEQIVPVKEDGEPVVPEEERNGPAA